MTSALVREAANNAKDVEARVNDFWDAVEEALSWVPGSMGWAVEAVKSGLADLRRRLDEFWARVERLFAQPGDSDRLKEVGEQWATVVAEICSDIAGNVGLEKMRSNIEWQGPAAEAYKAQVPPQAAGLNGIKDVALQIRNSLASLANSIDVFWLTIKLALATFLVAVVGAIAAACTIVGVPVAIATVAAGIGVALSLVVATVAALESHANTIETEQTALHQKVKDLSDDWPLVDTTAMTDATTEDGDPSDWRPNR
ncbi:hypothetical protein ACOBQX_28785 [Actinokineospora sp. G85]|uniref:hypothetical protein n=1 Tax=Actinokineospora sp. G85 TaxID=3406626 RepID=UPI003C78D36D